MDVPSHLRQYPCSDYFSSEWAERGCWDDHSGLWVIVPAQEVEEDPGLGFLQVGRPGVDGIGFGYRRGHPGLWAYYPIDKEFVLLAATLAELVEGWLSSRIKV
jgi:hypothetical protein